MKEIIKAYKFNDLGSVKNFFTLFSGTIISQIITLITLPFLSRYFNEADHGMYGNYITILSYFSVAVTLRFELAIVFTKSISTVNHIIKICLFNSLVVSFFSFILILAYQVYFHKFLNWNTLNAVIFLLPISIFFNGIIQIFTNYYNRNKSYSKLSRVRLILSVFSNLLPFVLVYISEKRSTLILSYFLAQLLVVTFILLNNYNLIKKIFETTNPRLLKTIFFRYKNFAVYNTPSTLIDQLASTIPIIFVASKFGIVASGSYLMATKIISLPSAILSVPISQIFFQKISEKHSNGETIKLIFFRLLLLLSVISIFYFGIIFFFGIDLFEIVLGENWGVSGQIASMLAISGLVKFVVSPLSLILAATESLKILAFWQILAFICSLILVTLNWIDLKEYILFLVSSEVILYVIYYIIIRLYVK
jgi:O-antigen/teichoic acid export membrane protein